MSTEAVVTAIRESSSNHTPLRICGRSTWLTAGRPVIARSALSLRDDAGVVSYVPGDLTLTVRAGTTLSEIGRVTEEHDQWLPLDPFGSADGTIGATVATASSGPLAQAFGSPRDLLLGLEFVTGRCDVVRGGGKVVKNVAGFDLSRLLTGSWGTLGVITEVTVRLYARPKADRTFALQVEQGDNQPAQQIHALRTSPLMPFAIELVGTTVAKALGLGDRPTFLIRLGGNQTAVETQARVLAQLGAVDEVATDVWDNLRTLEGEADAVIRYSALPTEFLAIFQRPVFRDFPKSLVYANPMRGSARVAISSLGNHELLRTALHDRQDVDASSVQIFEKLPANLWESLAPSAVSDPLSRGIRKAYDPHNLLNPGLLGD